MSNAANVFAPLSGAAGTEEVVRHWLTAGDERLHIDAQTGRNRYGVPPRPDTEAIWFASSTASPITLRSYEAVAARIGPFLRTNRGTDLRDWAADIRSRLQAICGIEGSAVILAGSGTEAELLALSIARSRSRRPLVNIVVAPTETGSGVVAAAAGRHFLNTTSLSLTVIAGDLLQGIEPHSVSTQMIAIRDEDGHALPAARVDAAVLAAAEQAIADHCDILVHCLDTSKTGLSGLSREAAAALSMRWPDRCLVVVDACQFRCGAEQVRQDLADGFMVMVTGSKFVGGPPFAGALLVPPSLRKGLRDLRLPAGLQAYSAALDWPDTPTFAAGDSRTTEGNVGLYCRWEAALVEWERFLRIPSDRRSAVIEAFGASVRQGAEGAGLQIVPLSARPAPTIFSFLATTDGHRPVPADHLHRALGTAGFRVGQPVTVGSSKALRVALAAPQISDVAERLAAHVPLMEAMMPIVDDLRQLFQVWLRLR